MVGLRRCASPAVATALLTLMFQYSLHLLQTFGEPHPSICHMAPGGTQDNCDCLLTLHAP